MRFCPVVLLLVVSPAFAGDGAELFEKRVRPILVEHCYRCHSDNGKKPKGGLRVDGRRHLLRGGDSGPAIVPGKPDASKLIEAVKYDNPSLSMPPKAKLPPTAIADLEAWVLAGAPWLGDAGTTTVAARPDFDLAKRKAEHWSWTPVTPQPPPRVKNGDWPRDPVDRFILAKLEEKGLQPAQPAENLVWLRRVTLAITGLPPTAKQIDAFLADPSSEARACVVDRLLASPAFGVRWGRHWLDLVRYGESRGHEYDPAIPNAWQYRDYIVRALNADVPYNRLVLEHIAGDVVQDPRLDPNTRANESILGTGFWHLGEEVHSPVDIRQDQADRLDNRIDVLTKAFLGLTVSCARCHDHKFDAISTRDYYALYGLLEGSSYRQVRLDGWKENRAAAAALAKRRAADAPVTVLPAREPSVAYRKWLARTKVVASPGDFLPDDVSFRLVRPGDTTLSLAHGKPELVAEERAAAAFDPFWAKLSLAPHTLLEGGALARQQRAGFTVCTGSFILERDNLYYLVRGGGSAFASVCDHTVISGPLHASLVHPIENVPSYRWVTHNLAGYRGQRLHVELTANPRTAFAVALVVQADTPPPEVPAGARVELPADESSVAAVRLEAEKQIAATVKWESRLAPALLDGTGVDEAVFIRGNPKTLGELVPHRGLEALYGRHRIAHTTGSGRLEFARELTDPARNPYLARIAVNRVWHHLFGRGLVASTDNFGVLGERPTHPELLDYLASQLVEDGWSIKRLVRRLVLTSTYGMSSDTLPTEADAANLLLHGFRLKRLEGEAIRDAILACSGRLDTTIGGPPVPVHLTHFLDGRGRPDSGPLDGAGRRSLYLAVRRNFLSPFLQLFDTPIPFSTVGRRQVSNVPAQALVLLNDPFVHEQAAVWGKKIAEARGSADARIAGMVRTAFGRPATPTEIAACRPFVAGRESDAAAWAEVAHALFNAKEFIFVR